MTWLRVWVICSVDEMMMIDVYTANEATDQAKRQPARPETF